MDHERRRVADAIWHISILSVSQLDRCGCSFLNCNVAVPAKFRTTAIFLQITNPDIIFQILSKYSELTAPESFTHTILGCRKFFPTGCNFWNVQILSWFCEYLFVHCEQHTVGKLLVSGMHYCNRKCFEKNCKRYISKNKRQHMCI